MAKSDMLRTTKALAREERALPRVVLRRFDLRKRILDFACNNQIMSDAPLSASPDVKQNNKPETNHENYHLNIIKTTGINPAAFLLAMRLCVTAARSISSISEQRHTRPMPHTSNTGSASLAIHLPTPARGGTASHLRQWADHSQAVAECVAKAAADISSGDYLVHGIGNPFPLHVSNVPEIRDQIGQMSL